MKKILFLVALFASVSASALAESEPVEAPVLRQVKVKGVINRDFVKRTENSIEVRSEVVCTFEATANLYDTRAGNSYLNGNMELARCDSTQNGQPVKASLGGFMLLTRSWPGVTGEVKGVSAWLTVNKSPDKFEPAQPILNGVAGSRDVNAASFLVGMNTSYSTGGNQPSSEELFSANVEFVDEQ